MQRISEFLAGLIFGLGLIVAGMTDPGKVLGFLDLFGLWDPSLIFVMVGGIAVSFIAFFSLRKKQQTLLGAPLQLPSRRNIDRRLILGSLTFGVGWGLAGFCPGPALVAMAAGADEAFVFVLAMIAGMATFTMLENWRKEPF